MSGKKRWTAQEMRDEANRLAEGEKNCTGGESKHISMLRQGAELQERMEAVVKECERGKWGGTSLHDEIINDILRAARGESENENK